MMPCIFAIAIPYTAITIIFIVLSTIVAAFVRRRSRDKCLKDFSGTRVVNLEENYRSTGVILSAANSVVSKNQKRKNKVLNEVWGAMPTWIRLLFIHYDW